jgi:hypothetical protein
VELVKPREILHNDPLCRVGMILLRPLESGGHKPFLVEFQEVFAVGYGSDLRHQKQQQRRGKVTPPLIVLTVLVDLAKAGQHDILASLSCPFLVIPAKAGILVLFL